MPKASEALVVWLPKTWLLRDGWRRLIRIHNRGALHSCHQTALSSAPRAAYMSMPAPIYGCTLK